MSFMMSSPQPGAEQGLPRGELLATYATYAQAREQVDRLAATDFPVSAVSIVGKDLRVVERVRGRLNYAQVALSAGVRGVFFGGLIGVFLYLLAPEAGPGQILTSMLLGLAVWLIFGVIGFAMRRGQHGFASSQAVVPTAFDLVVAFDHAARARQELGLGGAAAAAPPRPSSWRARAAWSNATTRSKAVGTTACEDAKPCWPRRIAKPITPKISHTARPSSMEVRICPGPASGASR